jgi:hypothetical protein
MPRTITDLSNTLSDDDDGVEHTMIKMLNMRTKILKGSAGFIIQVEEKAEKTVGNG